MKKITEWIKNNVNYLLLVKTLVNIFILVVHISTIDYDVSSLFRSMMILGGIFFILTLIIDVFYFHYWCFTFLNQLLDFYKKVELKKEQKLKWNKQKKPINIYPLKGFCSLVIIVLLFDSLIINKWAYSITKKFLKWIDKLTNSYLFVLSFALSIEIIFLFALICQLAISRSKKLEKPD